jgi:hypothetical protein
MTNDIKDEPLKYSDAQLEDIERMKADAVARERQIHAIESDNQKAHFVNQLAAIRGGVSVETSIAQGLAEDAERARDTAYVSQFFGNKSDAVKANTLAKENPEQYQRLKVIARRLKLIA